MEILWSQLPSSSSSPLSLPSHKQKNTKRVLFLLSVPPAFYIEKVGVDFTLSLPPESTFSYKVPLTTSMCSFPFYPSSPLSSVIFGFISWLTPEGYFHLSSPFTTSPPRIATTESSFSFTFGLSCPSPKAFLTVYLVLLGLYETMSLRKPHQL